MAYQSPQQPTMTYQSPQQPVLNYQSPQIHQQPVPGHQQPMVHQQQPGIVPQQQPMTPQQPGAAQRIGVYDQYIARQPETLVLREKVLSLSGDSFEIKFQSGQPQLRVQGKVMSISGRKSVFDMANNHLFDIVKEHFHIHTTFAAVDPTGKKVLEVKSSFARTSPPKLN
jgi:hypothetical protein